MIYSGESLQTPPNHMTKVHVISTGTNWHHVPPGMRSEKGTASFLWYPCKTIMQNPNQIMRKHQKHSKCRTFYIYIITIIIMITCSLKNVKVKTDRNAEDVLRINGDELDMISTIHARCDLVYMPCWGKENCKIHYWDNWQHLNMYCRLDNVL